MKFICLGFYDEKKFAQLPQQDVMKMVQECFAYDEVLRRGGHFIGGEALDSARNAVTLRTKDGQVEATDGPFAETKELLGGILLLEARDMKHAVELMSKHPGVKMGPFEIRPADGSVHRSYAEWIAGVSNSSAALITERVISISPRRIFAAFEQPEKLAQWWGPSGFTNTFEKFEFKPGGRWVFVMHGPNGADYPNESVFREIQPDYKIAIEHVVAPWFKLTVTLAARGKQTHLTWVQEFESAEVLTKLRHICEPANEQNLDRLEAMLARESS